MRSMHVPSMLQMCCRVMEVVRMREALIKSSFECKILSSIYKAQLKAANKESFKLIFSDSLK